MTTTTVTAEALQEARPGVRGRLAAAWTSFMVLYVYVDVLNLYKPGVVDDIRAGVVHEFETGPTFVALALTLIAIPSVTVWLSAVLPARAARASNLVVATLYVPVSLYNAAGEPWSYAYFYGVSIALEVVLLAYVLRTAWTWPRTARVTAGDDRAQAQADDGTAAAPVRVLVDQEV